MLSILLVPLREKLLVLKCLLLKITAFAFDIYILMSMCVNAGDMLVTLTFT